ncbi:MAG: hypothetical protein KatS3mg119_1900 [Rhodothalassiaceae bacterium]|nr:MAG: hypothetical protein KatS3mg119_1900 [Rhodothalassiaceae bacterium]
MSHPIDMARAERETLRWVLLLALWHARPYGTSEYVLLRTAQDIPLRVTPDQVRRELKSLAGRGLVTIRQDAPLWHAEIMPAGEDVVEYRAPAPAGIARPPQW